MDFAAFITLIRRRWLSIGLVTVLGGASGLALAATTPEEYEASTRLFVTVNGSDSTSAGEIAQGTSAAQLKVRSYAAVASSAVVLQPVIEQLHLPLSVGALAAHLTVESPQNTVLIDMSVRDHDPALAARIANAIAGSFTAVVSEKLERAEESAGSGVTVTTIQPATTPATAVAPSQKSYLAVGLLLGLVIGLASAFIRNILDTRLRSTADVESETSIPVLGSIGLDPESRSRPLVVSLEPRGPLAEEFRSLRTNFQFLECDRSARCFVISSALPAEGKTTTTANLAIALAETGSRVVLVDADLRRPRVAETMGLEGAVGLTDVLIGRVELDDVLQPWGSDALTVLPAGSIPPNPSELLGSLGMKATLENLNENFDYVLIDAPPLLPVTDAAVLGSLATGVVVVGAANKTRRHQLAEALRILDQLGKPALGVVLTMVPRRTRGGYGGVYGYYGETPAALQGRTTAHRNSERMTSVRSLPMRRSLRASTK